MNYPSIGEYNQTIQRRGGDCFKSLRGIHLIPSRTTPVKIYLFGSGAYAAVFKGILNGRTFALRCFLTSENDTVDRYKAICNYLDKVNSSWKTDCQLLEQEIFIKDKFYPILKMEWIDGILINEFVTQNLYNNDVLSRLQAKLVEVSNDLEKNNIGHGDLQCGNIIISEQASGFSVKLIDYDGMYVPELRYKRSIEKGRSEFQHPKRTLGNFNSEMDRFSFWVMLTALEALKLDKTLWREVMQGGFNTLDNFLFTIQDFLNPQKSRLFNRLYSLHSSDLNFYLDKLKMMSTGSYSEIIKPVMANANIKIGFDNPSLQHQNYSGNNHPNLADKNFVPSDKIRITAPNSSATVLTSNFQKIGTTPIELDKWNFQGKTILVSNGRQTKRVALYAYDRIVEVIFDH